MYWDTWRICTHFLVVTLGEDLSLVFLSQMETAPYDKEYAAQEVSSAAVEKTLNDVPLHREHKHSGYEIHKQLLEWTLGSLSLQTEYIIQRDRTWS